MASASSSPAAPGSLSKAWIYVIDADGKNLKRLSKEDAVDMDMTGGGLHFAMYSLAQS